jgi:hypothetical protein
MAAAFVLSLGGCSDAGERGTGGAATIPDSSTLQGSLERACERAEAANDVAVMCPRWLPSMEDGLDPYRGYTLSQEDFESRERCEYLTQLGYSGDGAGRRIPSHVLFGGRCDPWPLAMRQGRWPSRVGKRAGLGDGRLRMVNAMRIPGRTEARIVKPRVVGEASIADGRALLLWFAAHPAGGIHGGHYGVVWNSAGDGYAVTLHYDRGDPTLVGRGRSAPLRRAERRALLRTAREMARRRPRSQR